MPTLANEPAEGRLTGAFPDESGHFGRYGGTFIAETGAGQHGVAAATVAARLGLECVVYVGAEDVERQAPNVYRMKLLGASVVPVTSGSKTLKDVTGAGHLDVDAVRENVRRVKAATGLPVGVGFGVRDAQSAAAIAEVADAVVVASVLLEQSEKLSATPEAIPGRVAEHVAAMRLAMGGAS